MGQFEKVIPLPAQSTQRHFPRFFTAPCPPKSFSSTENPVYAKIPQTQLLYATNTDSAFFLYTPTNEYYFLAAGRWFRFKDLQGHWGLASMVCRRTSRRFRPPALLAPCCPPCQEPKKLKTRC